MIRIVRAVQTAMACPSQWDAWDTDGNYYYLRYRHGSGSVTQYQTENWTGAPWLPEDQIDKTVPGWAITANTEFVAHITSFEYGHPLDGSIELPEFCELAGLELDPAAMVTGWGDHLADMMITEGLVSPDVLTDGDPGMI